MTEENMNKVYWIIACLVIVIAIGASLIVPSIAKIKAQSAKIGTEIDSTEYINTKAEAPKTPVVPAK